MILVLLNESFKETNQDIFVKHHFKSIFSPKIMIHMHDTLTPCLKFNFLEGKTYNLQFIKVYLNHGIRLHLVFSVPIFANKVFQKMSFSEQENIRNFAKRDFFYQVSTKKSNNALLILKAFLRKMFTFKEVIPLTCVKKKKN